MVNCLTTQLHWNWTCIDVNQVRNGSVSVYHLTCIGKMGLSLRSFKASDTVTKLHVYQSVHVPCRFLPVYIYRESAHFCIILLCLVLLVNMHMDKCKIIGFWNSCSSGDGKSIFGFYIIEAPNSYIIYLKITDSKYIWHILLVYTQSNVS